MTVDLNLPIAFADLLKPSRFKCWEGGRGSAKSWSFARVLTMRAVERPIRVLCCREFQNSIADSVKQILEDTISGLHLESHFEVQRDVIKGPRGSEFFFEGLWSNVSRIKSYERIDYAWVAQAESVSQLSIDTLIPTVRAKDSEIWLDLNPDQATDPAYRMFITDGRPGAIVRHVDYHDNPWFPEVLRSQMEWDRAHDPDKYRWIWEGRLREISDASVFAGKWIVEPFVTPGEADFLCGMDFGFSVDPTTVVRMFTAGRTLYVDAEAYGVGVEIDETPQLLDAVLPHQKWPCRADSARPETISYLNNRGYNIIPAKKGPGSIEEGIEFLRSFERIVIHPRCTRTIEEMKLYRYRVDPKTNDILPVVVDRNNHCIDAMRYGTEAAREPVTYFYRGDGSDRYRVSLGDLGL